jgi:acyl-CoA thioesterase FadM
MRRIWEEKVVVEASDLDPRGEVAPGVLCRLFGTAAGHHATELGLGDEVLRPQGVAWMLHRLEVQFRNPAKGTGVLSVETWPSERTGRLRAERDFTICDGRGETVAEGLSTWLLIQLETRRPARMPARVMEVAVRGKPAPFESRVEPERAMELTEARWSVPAGWPDLDINGHANFARLVEWALAAAPACHWAASRLEWMALKFEQEVLAGEVVTARFALNGGAGVHELMKENGEAAVRGWTRWSEV